MYLLPVLWFSDRPGLPFSVFSLRYLLRYLTHSPFRWPDGPDACRSGGPGSSSCTHPRHPCLLFDLGPPRPLEPETTKQPVGPATRARALSLLQRIPGAPTTGRMMWCSVPSCLAALVPHGPAVGMPFPANGRCSSLALAVRHPPLLVPPRPYRSPYQYRASCDAFQTRVAYCCVDPASQKHRHGFKHALDLRRILFLEKYTLTKKHLQ